MTATVRLGWRWYCFVGLTEGGCPSVGVNVTTWLQIDDNPPLTAAEVRDIVERIFPWKAPGVDGMPNSTWKGQFPVLEV